MRTELQEARDRLKLVESKLKSAVRGSEDRAILIEIRDELLQQIEYYKHPLYAERETRQ